MLLCFHPDTVRFIECCKLGYSYYKTPMVHLQATPSWDEPTPLWEDEDAVSPVQANSFPVTGSVTIQGSGDDLEESKSQAVTLLKATDIEVTTVDDEDAGAIQGTLLGVGDGIEDD